MIKKQFTLLFVCTGNSCRSPMAEAILKQIASEKNIDGLHIHSAGTHPPVGHPPTAFTIHVMSEHSINIKKHKARLISSKMLDESNLILVMEEAHLDYIRELMPAAASKSYLLSSFGERGCGEEIPDPIGRNLDFYREVRNILESEIVRIIPSIVKLI